MCIPVFAQLLNEICLCKGLDIDIIREIFGVGLNGIYHGVETRLDVIPNFVCIEVVVALNVGRFNCYIKAGIGRGPEVLAGGNL